MLHARVFVWSVYYAMFPESKVKVPCLITHGDADTEVPIIQSKRLAECLAGEVKFEILPGANHGYKEGNSMEVMANLMSNWFKEHL